MLYWTLVDGHAPTRSGRTTIRQVAEAAGVSAATVSRVLNGTAPVTDDVRETVLQTVRDLRYSSGRGARTHPDAPMLVAVSVPLIHHSYFSEILNGVSEALYEHDISMVLYPTQHQHARETTMLHRLMQDTTSGALLVLPEESGEEFAGLLRSGHPFVIIDPHTVMDESIPTVSASNVSGAVDATEHLLELGHRRIGVLTGPTDWLATEERLLGFRGVLGARGIELDPALVVESNFRDDGGRAGTEQLLSLPDPPSAIFAFNDMLAIGVMQVATDRGLRVPEDLSIIGFDDVFEASVTHPALTTVRQPLAEMGRMAVNQLVRLIHGRRIEALHVELATKLIERESTAAPHPARLTH